MLRYACKEDSGDRLNCEFFETRDTRDMSNKDVPFELKKAAADFESDRTYDKERCFFTEKFLRYVRNPKTAQPPEELNAQDRKSIADAPPEQSRVLRNGLEAASLFCRNPTRQNWMKIQNVRIASSMRTCIVP